MILTLLLKLSLLRDNTFNESPLRQTWRLKLNLKQHQLPKSSLISRSLQTTLTLYGLLLNKVTLPKPRRLLQSRRTRSQQQMSKRRRRLASLHVQTKGNHPAATACRRHQRSAQSRLRFYYCCFSLR